MIGQLFQLVSALMGSREVHDWFFELVASPLLEIFSSLKLCFCVYEHFILFIPKFAVQNGKFGCIDCQSSARSIPIDSLHFLPLPH